ncbi:MAG: NUDIX domain-containing protein [Ilumatobacteraceae bacterium]
MSTPDAEQIQHVDLDGQVLGMVSRASMRAKNLRHRAVYVVVQSEDGRLLIHRRSESKDVWPGWWDIAVGGVVIANESYEVAALRELDEEIGLSGVLLEYLGDGQYSDSSVNLIGRCFRVRSSGPFVYRDGEVEESKFVTPTQFAEMIAVSKFVPDSLALVLPHLEDFYAGTVYDVGKPGER